jgi:putative peptide maturation dehydrogenase
VNRCLSQVTRIRRTPYAFFYLEDHYPLDLAALLRAELPKPAVQARVVALTALTGERHVLDRNELSVLASIPSDGWSDRDGRDHEAVESLLGKALLVSDAEDADHAGLRQRDEALSANQWNLYAALYHYMTQWSSLDIRDGDEDESEVSIRSVAAAQAFGAQHGPAPPPFAAARSGPSVKLPGVERDGALYRTLTSRRTTRVFDPHAPMTLEQLDTVLLYVFGCHGYAHTAADADCIKRTSPSGGGLHPIEAYPIVSNVAGVNPGIYHYNSHDHSLELVTELDADEACDTCTSFMCGQSYLGAAAVSFVLTARFYRNHWKYRRHQKAYAGILMDAAHLSQTLYLVSSDLDLGAYVTIAINSRDIESRLHLDGVSEGVIAMNGCGARGAGGSPLELDFGPWRRD